MFSFEPSLVNLDGAREQQASVRNHTDQAQTIDDWELIGDSAAFQTSFIGQKSVQLEPGQGTVFSIRFLPSDDQPRTAVLLARSSFDQSKPAQLQLVGIDSRQPNSRNLSRSNASTGPATECKSVAIAGTTRDGHANSIMSALSSVGAAWTSVLNQQTSALVNLQRKTAAQVPKVTPRWAKTFDSLVAKGLGLAVEAVAIHLSGGLAYATWNVLQRLRLDATAIVAEKEITALTGKVHAAVTGGILGGITSSIVTAAREAVMAGDEPVPEKVRDAFFQAQVKTLSDAYADAMTTLNNSEGDFVALEAQHAGLGFAALEAYRQHLRCDTGRIAEIQANKTLGMWSAFQAQLALGTHEPESWENAASGVALEKNIYKSTDGRHKLRNLANGVLEIGVIWSYDRRRTAPISQIRHARISGLPPELKSMFTNAQIGEYNVPIIVQGKVTYDSYAPNDQRERTTQLRIGRNEGGAITLAAESGTASARMLEDLGGGDVYTGARELFACIDALKLASVE